MDNWASYDDADVPSDGERSETTTVSNFARLVADVMTLAWNLAFPIVGGVLLGRYLDDRLGQDYTWTLSLLVLGVLVAFSNLYTMYIEHGQVEEPKKEEKEQEQVEETQDEGNR